MHTHTRKHHCININKINVVSGQSQVVNANEEYCYWLIFAPFGCAFLFTL